MMTDSRPLKYLHILRIKNMIKLKDLNERNCHINVDMCLYFFFLLFNPL